MGWGCGAVRIGRRIGTTLCARKAVGERMVRLIGGETSAVSMPDRSTRTRWEPGPPASPEAPVVSISLPVLAQTCLFKPYKGSDRILYSEIVLRGDVRELSEHLFNSTETVSVRRGRDNSWWSVRVPSRPTYDRWRMFGTSSPSSRAHPTPASPSASG